jgi:PEP-CTERM motif
MCRRAMTKGQRRIVLALVAGWLVGGGSTAVHAAVLAYDPFLVGGTPAAGQYKAGNEDAGTDLLGGQNPTIGPSAFYAGPWEQADATVVKDIGSLSYPSFQPGQGGQVRETAQFGCCTFGRNGRPIGDVFGLGQNGLGGGRDSQTIYESFLIDWGTIGTNSDNGNQGAHNYEMWNGTPTSNSDGKLAVNLGFNYYAGDTNLTLNVSTGAEGSKTSHKQILGAGLTRDALAAVNGGTHLVVLKFEFNDSDGEDRVTAYLDPTNSIPGSPAASVGVTAGDLFITHHSAFSSYQFDGGGANPGAIDEIRWGNTFADVTPFVPEPATIQLLVLGAMGLISRRRKRGL